MLYQGGEGCQNGRHRNEHVASGVAICVVDHVATEHKLQELLYSGIFKNLCLIHILRIAFLIDIEFRERTPGQQTRE